MVIGFGDYLFFLKFCFNAVRPEFILPNQGHPVSQDSGLQYETVPPNRVNVGMYYCLRRRDSAGNT